MSDLRQKVARSLMITRGGCDVTNWREAEWNPHVAQALTEADAAIAVCMEEAAQVIAQRRQLLNQQYEALDVGRENAVYDICLAALRALRGEGGVDG